MPKKKPKFRSLVVSVVWLVLFLEHHQPVRFQVAHIDRFAFGNDRRVFAAHQPAHVGEKEPAMGVMRIRVRIAVFVVLTMVSHPYVQTILRN